MEPIWTASGHFAALADIHSTRSPFRTLSNRKNLLYVLFKMSSQIKRGIRWIIVAPGAIVSAYLVWLATTFLNRLSLSFAGLDPDEIFGRLYIEVVSSGLMGAAFVYSGTRIAPANRKIVARVLAVFAVLIAGVLLAGAVIAKNSWAIVGCICLACGAAVVAYWVVEVEPVTESSPL